MKAPNWQQSLIGRHPRLFLRSYRGLPIAPGYPFCPDGWREVVAIMVDRVACSAKGYPVHFSQIAQKCGRLSICWHTTARLPKRVENAIDEAIALCEARSACSCAKCGAAGRLFCAGGLLLPACPAHAEGEALPAAGDFENVYLIRQFTRENLSVVVCRQYDRARDTFMEIAPSASHEDYGVRQIPSDSFLAGWPSLKKI